MSSATARTELWDGWAQRWRAFQESYVPDRERQLAAISDHVEVATWGRAGRILDLGSGPGSVADAVLLRCPAARAVAVDLDPWLIELGRRTARAGERIDWVGADLRRPAWVAAVPGGPYDAVTSATTLHWLDHSEVRRLYGDAARLLACGGTLLVADVLPTGSPGFQRRARAAATLREGAQEETWDRFWRDARAVPEFAELVEERDRRLLPRRPCVSLPIEAHAAALAEAGFRDVGEVWRVHEAAVLAAVR